VSVFCPLKALALVTSTLPKKEEPRVQRGKQGYSWNLSGMLCLSLTWPELPHYV